MFEATSASNAVAGAQVGGLIAQATPKPSWRMDVSELQLRVWTPLATQEPYDGGHCICGSVALEVRQAPYRVETESDGTLCLAKGPPVGRMRSASAARRTMGRMSGVCHDRRVGRPGAAS